MPVSAYTEQHLLDQVFSLQAGTVNAALTAGQAAVTAITCTALGEQINSGEVLYVSWGTANVEAFTASANALVGATSIAVTSQTSSKAHAIGDLIVRFPRFVAPANAYVGLLAELATLNAALTAGVAVTSITTTGLNYAVTSGDVILLGTNGEYVVASASAIVGATTISIQSFSPKVAYSIGAALTDVTTPTEASGGSYARVQYAATLANWPAASGLAPASKKNANAITFPASTASWGANPFAAFGVWDAPTAGNLVWVGYLTTPQSVGASGITPSFAANQLTATLA